MYKLDTFPYHNEKTESCSLRVDALRQMESKKNISIKEKEKELLNELDENNMEYRIHYNHSMGMKIYC